MAVIAGLPRAIIHGGPRDPDVASARGHVIRVRSVYYTRSIIITRVVPGALKANIYCGVNAAAADLFSISRRVYYIL